MKPDAIRDNQVQRSTTKCYKKKSQTIYYEQTNKKQANKQTNKQLKRTKWIIATIWCCFHCPCPPCHHLLHLTFYSLPLHRERLANLDIGQGMQAMGQQAHRHNDRHCDL